MKPLTFVQGSRRTRKRGRLFCEKERLSARSAGRDFTNTENMSEPNTIENTSEGASCAATCSACEGRGWNELDTGDGEDLNVEPKGVYLSDEIARQNAKGDSGTPNE